MAGIFTKRIWQPCICQPNELKREMNKKTGGAKQKSGGHGPPLESPLDAGQDVMFTQLGRYRSIAPNYDPRPADGKSYHEEQKTQ